MVKLTQGAQYFFMGSAMACFGLGLGGIVKHVYSNNPNGSNQEKIIFTSFPKTKIISTSLEDYVNIRGKNPNDYDMLQIYDCKQSVPYNTEMVVNNKEDDKEPCNGIALILKDNSKKPFSKPF